MQSTVFRCTDNALCVLIDSRGAAFGKRIVVLRLHVAAVDLNRIQLIAADVVQNFLTTGFDIKGPG